VRADRPHLGAGKFGLGRSTGGCADPERDSRFHYSDDASHAQEVRDVQPGRGGRSRERRAPIPAPADRRSGGKATGAEAVDGHPGIGERACSGDRGGAGAHAGRALAARPGVGHVAEDSIRRPPRGLRGAGRGGVRSGPGALPSTWPVAARRALTGPAAPRLPRRPGGAGSLARQESGRALDPAPP